LVLEFISFQNEKAPNLNEIEIENAKELKEDILNEYEKIYKNEKIVHGDLSGENILINEEGFYIIDWPQAIPSTIDFGEDVYKRDINNLTKFFKRKYGI